MSAPPKRVVQNIVGALALLVMLAMVLVASLPGASVLVVAWFRRTRPRGRTEPPLPEGAAHA